MEMSATGLELIKRAEGLRERLYCDVAGIPSIGYGHRLLPGEHFPDGISEAEAVRILSVDVREAERAVLRLVRVPLTQGQFDALVDFCFNLGAGRLAASTLLKALNARRYDAAREQLLRWDVAAGEVNAGLRARREAEARLWAGPARAIIAAEEPRQKVSHRNAA